MNFIKKGALFIIIFICSTTGLSIAQEQLQVKLEGGYSISLDKKGRFTFIGKKASRNLLLADSTSYLVRLKKIGDSKHYPPDRVGWKKKGENTYALTITFDDVELLVGIEQHPHYLSVELLHAKNENAVELVQWGEIFTTIADKVGLSIGAAYNDELAVGLMGLNLKSSGGFEINHRERFGNTAQRIKGGSVLQGFTRNRSLVHIDDNFIQELTYAVPVKDKDASIVGSKFALYCTDAAMLPQLIGTIEKEQGLPYLTHHGEWIKSSAYSTTTKFIMSYNVHNIDACLDVAERAGIMDVYHPHIFETWGTYQLDPKNFPEGTTSIAEFSDKAARRNIVLGAHALSNFITTSDPLVSPIPHPNLQLAGVTTLQENIGEQTDVIRLANVDLLKAYTKDELVRTDKDDNVNQNREIFSIRLNNEIIEYSTAKVVHGVIELSGCKRGAFKTIAQAHAAGIPAGRLVSHAYKVFFADINLQDTVAMNLARFFNEAKLKTISFDGVEGGVATGHNRYGGERFVKVFFDHLQDKNILANSSDVMHYAWHYFSNESWGEPWWAKSFKESQLDHRLAVQKSLKEDFLPRKMGQFSIKENTTVKDINWIMGLCAGYDAGVDFYVMPKIIQENPEGEQILEVIKRWEMVRLAGGFSEKQKDQLRDVYTIYGLKVIDNQPRLELIETWAPEYGKLQQENERNTLPTGIFSRTDKSVVSFDYMHQNKQTEPGMPTHTDMGFYCVGKDQPLLFTVRVSQNAQDPIRGLYLKSGATQLDVPFVLHAGDYLVLDQDQLLHHYSKDGLLQATQNVGKPLTMKHGQNNILVDYQPVVDRAGPEIIVNFKIEK